MTRDGSRSFFYAFFWPCLEGAGKSGKNFNGGGSCAHKNNTGMYGVQEPELQHDKGQEDASGQNGNQKVLQILQDPHVAQGNEVGRQRSEKMGKTEDKAPKESFFSGISAEFKKIIWPEKKSLARQTTAVIAVSVVMGLVIALLDFIIQYGVDFLVGLGL